MHKFFFIIFLAVFVHFDVVANHGDAFLYNLRAKPIPGDGIQRFLLRYHLPANDCTVDEFCRLNKVTRSESLLLDRRYYLPIHIYKYNGVSIRTTLNDPDLTQAQRIQSYNEKLLKENIRQTDYRKSHLLWVPHHEIACANPEVDLSYNALLGPKHGKIVKKGDQLKGQVFYLVAGHGGPDPGALGKSQGKTLCEDEYAYDVALRLYKLILEHGGHAEMVIQDPTDGIRDDQVLDCDQNERCNGEQLPLNQLKRLRQRVEFINNRFVTFRKEGYREQSCISIHVDSRASQQRQDVFFCHYGLSKGGKRMAQDLHRTFAEKYRKHQRGRKYRGTVEGRNLFVLKNTMPKAVLIELANIRNASDHQRILRSSNRQVLAQWIFDGIARA